MTEPGVEEVEVKVSPMFQRDWSMAIKAFSLCLLVLGAVFWSNYSDIVAIWWRSETFAHGFLILPIVAYLIWRRRAELSRLRPQPAPWALLLVLSLSLFWLLGYAAEVAVAQQLAAVAMLPAMAWVVFGTRVVRLIAFPLGYLLFAVPIGDFLVGPLQDVTAAFSVWALKLTGIPVYWEGRFFYIPSGSFEVAKACSGIRYLIASVALGTLYAYLIYTSLWRRLVFVGLSVVVPIIANGFRAYGIVMLAHLSDYKLAVGVDHLIYGWLFFGVVIFALFWVGSLFREPPASAWPVEEPSSPSPATGRAAKWAVAALALAISTPVLTIWLDARRAAAPVQQVALPAGRGGWSGPEAMSGDWRPHFVGAVEHQGEYRQGGRRVQVYLAYYPSQQQGAELINWQNRVFDEGRSRRLGVTDLPVPLGDRIWMVIETRVESAENSRLIWHWYEVNGTASIGRVRTKLHEALGRLSGSGYGSASWALSMEYDLTPDDARQSLKDFMRAMLPAMKKVIAP